MELIVEIRAAEGGNERPGIVVFKVSGKKAVATFANEAGGHRWQRIPPTEKKGRRQTSTIISDGHEACAGWLGNASGQAAYNSRSGSASNRPSAGKKLAP